VTEEREDLRARLRRLRRDGPPSAPTQPEVASRGPSGPPVPPSAPDSPVAPAPSPPAPNLRALLARRDALLASAPTAVEPVPAPPRSLSFDPPTRLERAPRGTHARTTRLPRHHQHGARTLHGSLVLDRALLATVARDPRLAAIDLERAVFLDTETSGLSGGAGTYVFLVGLLTFTDTEAIVWQGFLADPRDERALLAETAERIAAASAIVSFFGKSFDRHRLEDKMRLHGLTPPFAQHVHLDLYWPLRRRHQGRFENCRLKTLERELCGVARADDLPGSFAPAAWFDFLAGRPHRLEGVFQHNLDDVLSLVTLLPSLLEPVQDTPHAAHGDRSD
jgi:hypothetical protein